MRSWSLILLPLASVAMSAQGSSEGLPQFEDYGVTEKFVGIPARPILTTPEQKRYRTRIRDGVLAGSGVSIGSGRTLPKAQGPNFAGHYFIIQWGRGSQCVMTATVDPKTGVVYDPCPARVQNFMCHWTTSAK